MATVKFTNNAVSKLAGSLTAIATSLSVTASEGSKFPSLSGGDWFMSTLVKLVAGAPVYEIVKVTARAGDVLTIVRGQEGTTATTFSAGDIIELRMTAGAADEFARIGSNNTFSGNNTFSNPLAVADATLAGQAASKGQMDTALALKAPLASPTFTGNPAAPTPSKGDNDTSLATTGFVKGEGFQYAGESSATGTATLTSAVVGNLVIGASASAHTQTLPLANAVRSGDTIMFFNSGAGAMTVQRQGSDVLDGAGGGTSIVIPQGDSAEFESNNSATWRLVGGSLHARIAAGANLSVVIMDNPTVQSVPNNTTTTITNWTSRLNQGNNFNTVTGVYTAPRAGRYLVCAEVTFASASYASAGGEATIALFKNGAQERSARAVVAAAATLQMSSPHLAVLVNLAAGDTMEVRAYQTSGAAVNTSGASNTFLTIKELM